MTSSGPSPRKIKKVEDDADACSASSEWDSDDPADGIDKVTRKVLSDLQACQKELDELSNKAGKEVLEIATYFQELRKPVYAKRAAVTEKIPDFWVNAIVNHPELRKLVTKEEKEILQYLKQLVVEEFENVENGFRLKFIFDVNPFFENKELVKEFRLGSNTEPKSTSTTIKWKEQGGLSKEQPQLIDSPGGRGLELEQKTFFLWFSDNDYPAADDFAEMIRDELWPNALFYFRTPAMEDESRDESEDEEDSDSDPDIIEQE